MKGTNTFEGAGYLIRRLQQEIRNDMDKTLGRYDLTPPQFATLLTLKLKSEASNADLARASFVTPQTMVRIIANLEAAELIKKKNDPVHGRILKIELTEKGEKLITKCQSLVGEHIEGKILKGFSKTEAQQFKDLLSKSLKNF
ncbi:MAG TPA: MarR family transcriptional regulator [Bdellovibrio sp.]|uniref:MarR family winged helix-turn-helix transcriptional regulator n=1 Tax=Bdellovibrio sp. TaxID=28201 RepID=UPI002EF19164